MSTLDDKEKRRALAERRVAELQARIGDRLTPEQHAELRRRMMDYAQGHGYHVDRAGFLRHGVDLTNTWLTRQARGEPWRERKPTDYLRECD